MRPAAPIDDTGLLALLRADSHLPLDLTGSRPFGRPARPGLRVRAGTVRRAPADWSGVRAALVRTGGHIA
ncbi:hypothetical protein TU94_26985 [Streptomyces cyaneogriseus subsp. noncyanogenus]|uniref:Uncharacterized protein n=1 Tax=Streptomyces cyaneogriseus subsp. noncyanogenus TaxID=477245 RepID=A0A0C5G8B6_9ACTN|nr:hypothetical protein [Streptomyces cyaneogriseus]AJP04559.1 hypothetical protein TU94_26985 [Streptomyces cyaneogriseus subsp. noncyanogenus]